MTGHTAEQRDLCGDFSPNSPGIASARCELLHGHAGGHEGHGSGKTVWWSAQPDPLADEPAFAVHVQPTRYQVCAVPERIVDADAFAINVVYRGRGLWAVTRHDRFLSADGVWGWDPDDSTRFDLDTALGLAKEAAPHITVNGHTVAEALEGDHQ